MPFLGALDNLTEDQRAILLEYMEQLPIQQVLLKVVSPPPNGFGIKTHITSLRRFYQRARREALQHQLAEDASSISPSDLANLERAAAGALTHYALETMTLPGTGSTNLAHITKWLIAVRGNEIRADRNAIARERLALADRKLQLSAAQATAATQKTLISAVECIFGSKQIPEVTSTPV